MQIEDLMAAPQIGEFVWHQQTQDLSVDDMSERHLATLRVLAAEIAARGLRRPLRVLELGAYRHYSGHVLAQELDADVWLSDISASALEFGRDRARERGYTRIGQICAADFHDLPFADGWFDIVFIASAVHHTPRTEAVLREMARVTRNDGLIWLENEPVGRSACLYLFNSNRPESYTAYESALVEAGMLRLVSSPFHGTRPEEMFAMVENDRIPLDLYLAEFERAGHTDYLHLEMGTTCQDIEKRLLSICEQRPEAAVEKLTQLFSEALEHARRDDWVARALGFREPTRCELITLAGRVVEGARAMRAESDPKLRERARARLFGAALQAKIRRRGDAGSTQPGSVFRRQPVEVNGCWLDTGGPAGAAFLGMRAQFPDVFDPAAQAQTLALFAEHGWTTVTEEFGAISLTNLGGSASLPQPTAPNGAILLMRLYTVPRSDGPYLISIRQGHRMVTSALVAQAESRLLRGLVHAGAGEIYLEHFDLRGRPLAIEWNLRVSVLQMLSLADG